MHVQVHEHAPHKRTKDKKPEAACSLIPEGRRKLAAMPLSGKRRERSRQKAQFPALCHISGWILERRLANPTWSPEATRMCSPAHALPSLMHHLNFSHRAPDVI